MKCPFCDNLFKTKKDLVCQCYECGKSLSVAENIFSIEENKEMKS